MWPTLTSLGEALHIRGKARRQRITPISPTALAWIKRYMELRRHGPKAAASNQEAVFVNKHGQRLSTRSVRRKLDKYLAIAGLDPDHQPAHAAAQLRDAYAVARGRSAERAGNSWASVALDDTDLHARDREPG